MKSNSEPPVIACLRKEFRAEFRSRQGMFLSGLFGLMALSALSFASFNDRPSPDLTAGLLAVLLIFVASTSVPRTFLTESDQGTFDLVRQWGNSGAVFLGKVLFCATFMIPTSIFLGVAFVEMVHVPVMRYGLLIGCSALLGVAASNVLALTSAMVMTARNRWVLGMVVALPLMFPLVFFGIGAVRVALGIGSVASAWQSLFGLLAYAAVPVGIGPAVAEALWEERAQSKK